MKVFTRFLVVGGVFDGHGHVFCFLQLRVMLV